MKTLLMVLLLAFSAASVAAPKEPPMVAQARRGFFEQLKAYPHVDPKRCTFKLVETTAEAYAVVAKCDQLPFVCLFDVRKAPPLASRTVGCAPNAGYSAPAPSVDSKLKM